MVGDWTKTATYWHPPSSSGYSSISFSFCWAAQPGAWGPASTGSRYLSSNWNTDFKLWFPTNSTSLSHRVISLFFAHLLPVASQFAFSSTHRQSRLSPDIFDRMHLLFTRVHLPFDSSARSKVNMLQSCFLNIHSSKYIGVCILYIMYV